MNSFRKSDSEIDVDQLIKEYDETFMPLPDIELEPHLLISKVRKHYMEYMIKILSVNYETNQKLVNKNIYLPSAIWKCAKNLEMKAAQTCMVVQLYRKCIVSMINEVKTDTKKGRLFNKLYESLHVEPQNEKRTQTAVTGDQCRCHDRKRRRKRTSPIAVEQCKDTLTQRIEQISTILQENIQSNNNLIQKIPVVTNMHIDTPEFIQNQSETVPQSQTESLPQTQLLPKINNDKGSDELMLQLEKLFEGSNDEDLFENSLFGTAETEEIKKLPEIIPNQQQDSIIENHAAQIKSLDERLATLTGLLATSNNEPTLQQNKTVAQKKPKHVSKWHCEEYFLRKGLFELMYQIGDNNRRKLSRIKELFIILFGEDSDDEEGLVSPNETPELIASCKSRIDGWVMTILAPYYAKGRIQGKGLYKSVARHLIELIYKCKQYPSRYEVTSFVLDFLENRGKIRCEADYKEFRIDNIQVPHTNHSLI